MELNPDQIITLNDYPLHSDDVLIDYFNKCKQGKKIPLVPVVRKNIVVKYFDDKILKAFKTFEGDNPTSEYFMLNGSHRTTAATLTGRKITVIIYDKDEDVIEAKELIAVGQIREDDISDTVEENCKILNKYFNEKPYFMTVEQKTKGMIEEKIIPQYMINSYD